jgi:hypothetical protein
VVTEADIGKLVRIRSVGGAQHWMRGRLIDIISKGRIAVVHPFTHRRFESVPVAWVKVWKSKS